MARKRLASVRALLLRRRDAEDLVVMSAARPEREGEVVDLSVQMLASMLRNPEAAAMVPAILADVLPWIRFLPPHEVDTFVTDFVDTARAAASIDSLVPIAQLLIGWEHTAEVYADPELLAILRRPTGGDFGRAMPPDVGDDE